MDILSKFMGTSYGSYEIAGFGYKKGEIFEEPIYYFSPSIEFRI